MKKTILLITITISCFISSRLMSSSSGAIKATGAPNEGNCTQCHGGTANSDPNGSASISIAGNPSSYVPGQAYQVSITTSYTGRSKFGFALSAKNTSNGDVGTFSKNGNNNVQVMPQKYVTHTFSGTASTDSKTWTFQWTAPATDIGQVTFYASGLAANNNGDDDSGDKVYTPTLTLPASINSGVEDLSDALSYSVYPNPVIDNLNVKYQVKNTGNVTIKLINIEGKVVGTLLDETVTKGQYDSRFDISNRYEKGIYFITIQTEQGTTMKKIVIL